jgi:hypothetical protein
MTAEIVNLEDAGAKLLRDRKVFRLRLEGESIRQIAEDLHCSVGEVQASMARMSCGVTQQLRASTVELECERLDALTKVYFKLAEGGDKDAAMLVIRLMDRRAGFMGTNIQPRGESAMMDQRPAGDSATDKILAALDRLAHGPIIEGEVTDDGPGS